MKKDYTMLKALIDGSPEREIYLKGKEAAKREGLSDLDSVITWLTSRLLNFRDMNREYGGIYPERYIQAYEEVLSKILTGETS